MEATLPRVKWMDFTICYVEKEILNIYITLKSDKKHFFLDLIFIQDERLCLALNELTLSSISCALGNISAQLVHWIFLY